jgi:flagellar protein FliJ
MLMREVMARSKRLKPIKKLAQNKEKTAAKELGHALDLLKHELTKLEQLKQYRIEYLEQMQIKVKLGVTGAVLQQYNEFLNKLDLAIKQQDNISLQYESQLAQTKEQWQNKRSEAKAISQVMDKMALKERQLKDKREANQNDEMSTQAFLRRQNNGF